MAEFGGTELTNGGRNILAKALAGKTIKFTRAFAGEGFLPEGQDISEMTGLIAPIREMGIAGIDIPLQALGDVLRQLEVAAPAAES